MNHKWKERDMPFIRVPRLAGSHPLVLANAVVVRLHWAFNGVPAFNVLGGLVGGGYVNSQSHANGLGTAILGDLATSGLGPLLATSTQLFAVGIRDVRVANQAEYISVEAPVAGTGSGDALPNQLAGVVTLRTALAGKSFRGRVYFSGAIEDENTSDGRIAGELNTALVDFMTAVQTDMATQGITLAVLSRPRFANLPPPLDVQTYAGAITTVIGIVTRDDEWDSQRRRKH
jgi:hypothetical protein